jgi:hypothetical protein
VVSLEHFSFQLQHKIPELERLNWRELEMLTIAGQLQVVIRSIYSSLSLLDHDR